MPIAQLDPEWGVELTAPSYPTAERLYAVLEPMLWPDWAESLTEGQGVSLFTQTRFQHIENGPVLVELVDNASLEAVQSHLASMPSGCLIYTPSSISLDDLAASLRSRLIVQHGQAQAIMRFYEPRKLLMLIGSMTVAQRQQFFPSVVRIRWFDREWLSATWQKPEQNQINPPIWDLTEQQVETMNFIYGQWKGVSA